MGARPCRLGRSDRLMTRQGKALRSSGAVAHYFMSFYYVLFFRCAALSHGEQVSGKRAISSCLLHDWILYSMGILIPSIRLVSSLIWIFSVSFSLIIVALCLVLSGYTPLFQLETGQNKGGRSCVSSLALVYRGAPFYMYSNNKNHIQTSSSP